MGEVPRGQFKVTIYCLCGASMVGSGAGDLNAVSDLQDAFWTVHHGEDHGPATAKQAYNARRRQIKGMVS